MVVEHNINLASWKRGVGLEFGIQLFLLDQGLQSPS